MNLNLILAYFYTSQLRRSGYEGRKVSKYVGADPLMAMLEIHCITAAIAAYIFPFVNLLEQAPTNLLR